MKNFIPRIACSLLFSGLAVAASQAQRELDGALRASPNALNGEALFDHCASCHGADGNGEADGSTPRIAGQHFRVLAKQLVDFRSGKRWDFRMEEQADRHHLEGPQDIADVAAYVSQLGTEGERGIGDGSYASEGAFIFGSYCAACHGPSGQGDAKKAVRPNW